MPLLNYTTSVAPEKSVMEIQQILAKAGARKIMIEYHATGVPSAVMFEVETTYGPRQFVLPAYPQRVLPALRASKAEPRYCNSQQAERVAWRILKDWAEAQLALISTEMVSLDEVMLPYMRSDDGKTVYEMYRDRQLALPAGEA